MTDNRTTELLPCPFCGGEYTQVRWIGFKDKSNGAFDAGYRGECCDCGALTRAYDTEAEAIEAWNTRADYHGYEQAAIEAWKRIKEFNGKAVDATLGRGTCHIVERNGDWYCDACGEMVGTCDQASELCIDGNAVELWNYCPNCGSKVIGG